MIVRSQIFIVLLCLYFQAFGNPISPEDVQTCTDLCNSCNGKTIINDGKCECSIAGDDEKGAECMKRMTKDGEHLGMIFEDPETIAEGEGRSVRCLLGSPRKYGKEDIQRVAQYFMNGGPLTGSQLKHVQDPSEKMVGASKSDLELPKLDSIDSKEPKLGAARENPWCPSSVFGKSNSGPLQPEYTYPKSNVVLGSTQQVKKPQALSPEPKQILGAPRQLEQPLSFSGDVKGILSSLHKLKLPHGFSAHSRILGAPQQSQQLQGYPALQKLQLPQTFSANARILGAPQLQQPPRFSADARGILGASRQPYFFEPKEFLSSLKLQIPQLSANSRGMLGASQLQQPSGISADPRRILGNFKLELPKISDNSRGMLGSSQLQQPLGLSADPRGILGNLQLDLPRISADSRGILGSSQLQQPLGISANPRGILGNLQMDLPRLSADSRGILGSTQLQRPLGLSADPRGILGNFKLELPKISDDSKGMLGSSQLQQPLGIFADPRGILGNLQLDLPRISADSKGILGSSQLQRPLGLSADPRGILGNLQLDLPRISADSRGILGSSQLQQPLGISADPKGILGNLQLDLPRLSADSRGILGAPQVFSSEPRGVLGNLQLQLPQGLSDSKYLGAAQQIQQPQYFPAVIAQIFNPQPFFDMAEAIGRIPLPVAQMQNLVGDSYYKAAFDSGSSPVGASQSKMETSLVETPKTAEDSEIVGAARKTEISIPKESQIVGAAKNDCGQPVPKVDATKSSASDILGAAKKTEVDTPKKAGTGSAAKKDKVVVTPKKADILGAAKKGEITDYPNKAKNVVDASLDNSGSNLGAAMPVQPGYTYEGKTSNFASETSSPSARFYTLNDLAAALGHRSMSGISNALGGFQIPRYLGGEPRQELLGDARSNLNCNNDAELQLNDDSIVGAPFRPSIGQLSRASWMPQALTSVVGIFQPLLEQGIQMAVAGLSGQPGEMESPQLGLAASATNLDTRQMETLNSPLGLSAQYLPNSNGYSINSQFSLPILPEPNSPTVGAPRLSLENNCPDSKDSFRDEPMVGAPRRIEPNKFGQNRITPTRINLNRIGTNRISPVKIGPGLTRPVSLRKLTRQSVLNRLNNTVRKLPRQANENSQELPEDVLNSAVNDDSIEKLVEAAIEKEIETLEKQDEKTLEQKLEKTLQKALKKRDDKLRVKLIELNEKPDTKIVEKATENIRALILEKTTTSKPTKSN